ncbi:MAG: type II secretion system protein GspD [Verrucomicrobiota bacterium]
MSCQHVPAEGDSRMGGSDNGSTAEEKASSADSAEEAIDVRERIRAATRFLEDDKLEAARREIAPLVREGRLPSEVNALLTEIEARRRTMEGRMTPEASNRLALDEVKAGLAIPENYGKTVEIPPMDPDVELPPGPMEELVNSPVSMDLEEADVAEIIEELSRIENMNIIADQALAGDAAAEGAEGEDGGFPPEGGGGGPTLTVKVREVPLREVLSYISRNMGIAFHVGSNIIWVTQTDGNTDNAPKLHTRVYKLRRGLIPGPASAGGDTGSGLGATAGGGDEYMDLDLEDALSYVLTDAEDPFRLFPKRNLLLARGTLEQLRRVEEMLRDFDIRPQQVLIEARFVTISHADLMRVSMDWSAISVDSDDASASLQPRISIGQQGSQSTEFSGDGSALSLSGVLGEVDFDVVIEAMRQTSSFRTLSAPRITVINNHEAEIKKGYTLRYWEEWQVQEANIDTGEDSEVNAEDLFFFEPVGSPQSENIGLSLKVRVNIGHDIETVLLSLTPASTQLDGFFNYGTGGDPEELLDDQGNIEDADSPRSYQLPKVTENSLATTVLAKSGQTVVLGGMIETREISQEKKVPFIGDIPLLGRFFRSEEDVSEPQHLLVFVTPRIINENGEFVRVNDLSPASPAGSNQ